MNALRSPARLTIHALMRRLEAGHVTLDETFPGGERLEFGRAGSALSAVVRVHDPALYGRLVRSKSLGLGETYAEGIWDAEPLVGFLRILARDVSRGDRLRRRLAPLLVPFQRLSSLRVLNTRRGARRNIAAHYDLGNEMFELFLDRETMMYSSARFDHAGQTLEEAQRSRLEHICSSLQLRTSDHLLEIGTGWGGLALHAAGRFGCEVTTTTLSREQREYAESRVRAAGLEGRVHVLAADYRDLEGRFDKLVSIEMIEAVGWEWFDSYFRSCSRLLTPTGLFFLQAIVMADAGYEAEKRSHSFAHLIFPGGCLPSVGSIQRSIGEQTDLRTIALEDISASYVLTLAEWRSRFEAAERQLIELGYERDFRRLWSLYLAISEAGFTENRIRDVQMLFAKPHYQGAVMPAAAKVAAAPA